MSELERDRVGQLMLSINITLFSSDMHQSN
jgi:hypothetical protein